MASLMLSIFVVEVVVNLVNTIGAAAINNLVYYPTQTVFSSSATNPKSSGQ